MGGLELQIVVQGSGFRVQELLRFVCQRNVSVWSAVVLRGERALDCS